MKTIKYHFMVIVVAVTFCGKDSPAMDQTEARAFINSLNSSWRSRDYADLKEQVEQQLQESPDSAFVLSVAQFYYLYVEGDVSKTHTYANSFWNAASNIEDARLKALAREFRKRALDIPLGAGGTPSNERLQMLHSVYEDFPNIGLSALFFEAETTTSTPAEVYVGLRISEIMYHAPGPQAGTPEEEWTGGDDFEYLEICNTSTTVLDLYGLSIEGAVTFTFSDEESQPVLLPGECVLIAANIDAFKARYQDAISSDIAGQYSGTLANDGEQVIVKDAVGNILLDVTYDDSWYASTDGGGHSLELVDPDGNMSSQAAWQASENEYGSPLLKDHIKEPLREWLRITEIMYHPSDSYGGQYKKDDYEFIELQNVGEVTIDLSNVSFTAGISFQFNGSNVTSLDPGQYVVVVKNEDAFKSRYDDSNGRYSRIAGEYTGDLSDSGEQITIRDSRGVLIDFAYDDEWFHPANGFGRSLVIVRPRTVPSVYGDKGVWRLSHSNAGGSPGQEDEELVSTPVYGSIYRNYGEDTFWVTLRPQDNYLVDPDVPIHLKFTCGWASSGPEDELMSEEPPVIVGGAFVYYFQLENVPRTFRSDPDYDWPFPIPYCVEGVLTDGTPFSVQGEFDPEIFVD